MGFGLIKTLCKFVFPLLCVAVGGLIGATVVYAALSGTALGILLTDTVSGIDASSITPALDHDQVLRGGKGARIGIVSIKYGSGNRNKKIEGNIGADPNELYNKSMATMVDYAKRWDYPTWIGRHKLLEGPQGRGSSALWSKEALVLSLIIDELRKEDDNRLEWVFFADADIVITNPNVPLETFLPPENDFGRTQSLLAAIDRFGSLNSGDFFVRVSQDGIRLLTTLLSYPLIKESEGRKISQGEQSAMAALCKNSKLREKITIVPPHWFNADIIGHYSPWVWHANWLLYQPGDLLVHILTEHKAGWSEILDQTLTGKNSSMTPPLSMTRYMSGNGTVARYWKEWETLDRNTRLRRLFEASRHQD